MSRRTLYHGPIIQSRNLLQLDTWSSAVVAVEPSGVIAWVEQGPVASSSLQETSAKHGWNITDPAHPIQVVEGRPGEWLMPGLVDTHTHAPQFPNLGTGQQDHLLDWLENTTFPTEARFKDLKYAREIYEQVVTRVLNNGTTTCCYYATLHAESTKVLADIAYSKGQRAFIGKCNMDRNSPSYYIEESAQKSLAHTEAVIDYITSITIDQLTEENPLPLVQPILTPRFAISCTDELLGGIKQIYHGATVYPLLLQTHVSENQMEVETTIGLFEHLPPHHLAESGEAPHHSAGHSYLSIYDHFGLLGDRTILAHGVHLSEGELELIQARNAGLSHCAGSNFNLGSGVAAVGRWLNMGIKVGLGTDVSGGFAPSLLTEIRHASITSKVRAMMDAPTSLTSESTPPPSEESPFTSARGFPVATLLYLATLGGASLCNLEDYIGSFAPEKQFDALYVSLRNGGNPAVWFEDSRDEKLEQQLERFLFGGDDRNIRKVWVKGRLVGGVEYNA